MSSRFGSSLDSLLGQTMEVGWTWYPVRTYEVMAHLLDALQRSSKGIPRILLEGTV